MVGAQTGCRPTGHSVSPGPGWGGPQLTLTSTARSPGCSEALPLQVVHTLAPAPTYCCPQRAPSGAGPGMVQASVFWTDRTQECVLGGRQRQPPFYRWEGQDAEELKTSGESRVGLPALGTGRALWRAGLVPRPAALSREPGSCGRSRDRGHSSDENRRSLPSLWPQEGLGP